MYGSARADSLACSSVQDSVDCKQKYDRFLNWCVRDCLIPGQSHRVTAANNCLHLFLNILVIYNILLPIKKLPSPRSQSLSKISSWNSVLLWVSSLIITEISPSLKTFCYTKARCISYYFIDSYSYYFIAPYAFHRKCCAESSCTLYIW